MYNSECGSPSLRHMIKSSIRCFRSPSNELEEPLGYGEYRRPRSARSHHEAMEAKDSRLCRGLFSRISARNRKRPHSADFRYDPLSYALNFEDDVSREDEFPVSFSSRLPLSPERLSTAPMVAAMPREIVAFT